MKKSSYLPVSSLLPGCAIIPPSWWSVDDKSLLTVISTIAIDGDEHEPLLEITFFSGGPDYLRTWQLIPDMIVEVVK